MSVWRGLRAGLPWMMATVCILMALALAPHPGSGDERPQTAVQGSVSSEARPALLLADAERSLLEGQALDGSAEAAYRVVMHYNLRGPAAEMDQVFWTQIAAENGHPTGQYAYAWRLNNQGRAASDPRLLRRACYWFREASRNGGKDLGPELRAAGCQSQ